MREFEIGFDGARITIPIRNAAGDLRGLLRYLPGGEPKMLAARGTRLGLIPHPTREPLGPLTLVEGPADMLAARAHGCPAIAVPGAHAWQPHWARLLQERQITIAMDCDPAGRAAAQRIANDLKEVSEARILDLAPKRGDGFDVTDWLRQQHPPRRTRCTSSWSSKPTITR
jgi:DNA primase